MDKIKELAIALGQAIKEDERVKKMDELNAKYSANEKLCAAVDEYNALTQTLTELYQNTERDEVAMDKVHSRLLVLYKTIYDNPLMIEYHAAQKAVDDLMHSVNDEITYQVTGQLPCSCDCGSCNHHCH